MLYAVSMKIQKKKSYRIHLVFLSFSLMVSTFFVTFSAVTSQALSLPEWLDRFSESRDKRDENARERNNKDDSKERESSTIVPATGTQSPQQPVSNNQTTQETSVQSRAANVLPISVQPAQPAQVATQVDTSGQVAQTAAAQSAYASRPIEYTSSKLSISDRNELLQGRAITLTIGILFYLSTYARPVWNWASRASNATAKLLTE